MEITDEQLRAAVMSSRSWRGVLRTLGLTSPRTGRELKARCDHLGLDYRHFGAGGRPDDLIRSAVAASTTWPEALAALGYASGSGSARAAVRKRCAELDVDVRHLTSGAGPVGSGFGQPDLSRLPAAAPALIAGLLFLLGHRVMWPLEPAPYDLLAMDDQGKALRVQVKATTAAVDETWVCTLTHSTYDPLRGRSVKDVYTADQIDLFGIVDGDLRMYLIPLPAVAGRRAIYLRHYAGFLVDLAPQADARIR